jgi:hypothetical protein
LDEEANASWLFVKVAVRNRDKKARMIPPFKLLDESGSEYDTSSKAWAVADSLGVFEELNPSVMKEGYILFDVPKDHQYKLLVCGGYWSPAEALIVLEITP